jgi:hypothetical protein
MAVEQNIVNPFGSKEDFGISDGTWILGGTPNHGSQSGGFTVGNIAPIEQDASQAFSYIEVPGGPRTLLNLLQSYGVDQNSSNNGSGPWLNSFSGNIPYVASPIANNDYFTRQNRVRIIDGDGSPFDGGDWVVFNFDVANGPFQDFDGYGNSISFFGGENSYSGGYGGLSSIFFGKIWGFSPAVGWTLLYAMSLGPNSTFSHYNPNWWTSGGTVTSGDGKRAEYDSLEITHLGFSVKG